MLCYFVNFVSTIFGKNILLLLLLLLLLYLIKKNNFFLVPEYYVFLVLLTPVECGDQRVSSGQEYLERYA